jgi:aminomethyltransferase folate-binding domain-containing protein
MTDLFGADILDVPYYYMVHRELDGLQLVITRTGYTGELGYELYLTDASRNGLKLWDAVSRPGEPHGLEPIGPCHIRRIEGGILAHGCDMTIDERELAVRRHRHVCYPANCSHRAALSVRARSGKPEALRRLQRSRRSRALHRCPMPRLERRRARTRCACGDRPNGISIVTNPDGVGQPAARNGVDHAVAVPALRRVPVSPPRGRRSDTSPCDRCAVDGLDRQNRPPWSAAVALVPHGHLDDFAAADCARAVVNEHVGRCDTWKSANANTAAPIASAARHHAPSCQRTTRPAEAVQRISANSSAPYARSTQRMPPRERPCPTSASLGGSGLRASARYGKTPRGGEVEGPGSPSICSNVHFGPSPSDVKP